ncbi:hypothetical protein Tco_1327285 [Tanacetum coccineum]
MVTNTLSMCGEVCYSGFQDEKKRKIFSGDLLRPQVAVFLGNLERPLEIMGVLITGAGFSFYRFDCVSVSWMKKEKLLQRYAYGDFPNLILLDIHSFMKDFRFLKNKDSQLVVIDVSYSSSTTVISLEKKQFGAFIDDGEETGPIQTLIHYRYLRWRILVVAVILYKANLNTRTVLNYAIAFASAALDLFPRNEKIRLKDLVDFLPAS